MRGLIRRTRQVDKIWFEPPILRQIQLLTSTPSAPRSAMQSEALKTAKEFEREARRRIQHMNIASADLDMRHTKKTGALDDLLDNGLLGSNHRELRPR